MIISTIETVMLTLRQPRKSTLLLDGKSSMIQAAPRA
jgi:hypothetical protein